MNISNYSESRPLERVVFRFKIGTVLGFYVCIYSHLKRRQIHPSWVAI
jgi:hypothetical protein